MNTVDTIVEKCKAGYPAIYLQSYEDSRTLSELKAAAKSLQRRLHVWTIAGGLKEVELGEASKKEEKAVPGTDGPEEVVLHLPKIQQKSIVVLCRMHHYMKQSPVVQQGIVNILGQFKQDQRTLIVLSPVNEIPPEMVKDFSYVEVQLPTRGELENALEGIVLGSRLTGDRIPNADMRRHLVDAALGLTMSEAQNAFALSLVRKKGWDPAVVMEEKCGALKKTGLLTYYPPAKDGMESIGGFEAFKPWVRKRKKAFSDDARKFGLSLPKGVLIVGPPGTGKSVGAKALAKELDLALLRVDMGAIFGGLVGESEKNARIVIQTAEAVAPCVLWIDELEKGFAGSSSSLDSGVGARVLGTFLTWMTEKTSPVFNYATANDVTNLPPELLRKGRFDEVWSVKLPTSKERADIFAIHIKKRGREMLLPSLKVSILADKAEGFSGSEIEAALEEAMFTAFDAGKELDFESLANALDESKPLSQTMKEKIDAIEVWCKARTRPVGLPEEIVQAIPTADKRQVVA